MSRHEPVQHVEHHHAGRRLSEAAPGKLFPFGIVFLGRPLASLEGGQGVHGRGQAPGQASTLERIGYGRGRW
jgi:hypothetical protein